MASDFDPFVGYDSPAATPVDPFAGYDEKADEAELLWAGRPTTMSSIKRVAEQNHVSPETILELGTPAGRIESYLSQNIVGQTVLRAGEGIKSVGRLISAAGARAVGHEDISRRIHIDRRKREEFLQFIEKGGDLSALIGERGNRIFNQTVQSVGEVGTSAVLAGPVGIYADTIGGAWEQGLDDAQRAGMDGLDSIAHAGRRATIEGGLTFLMGRIPGVTSLEESFSPAARRAVKGMVGSPTIASKLNQLVKELGGWTAEGVEEMMIAGGQQVNDISAGLSDKFDWEVVLEAGASGVAGRGTIGVMKGLKDEMTKLEDLLPEIAKGIRAAEIDLERGVNPFEVKDITDGKEFDRQTGREGTGNTFRDSYRDTLNFYIAEAREKGDKGAMERMEKDVARLRAEENARQQRVDESKVRAKAGKGKQKAVPAVAPADLEPAKTANQRAEFSLNDFIKNTQPPVDSTIGQPPVNVNPYLMAPWESETRSEKRIRGLTQKVQEHKQTITDLRKSAVENKRLREDQLKTAQELVQENVTTADQYRFITRIRNAKTPASIDKLLNDVGTQVEKREHNLAVINLKQSLRKSIGLRKEYAALVEDVKSGVDLKRFNGRKAAEQLRKFAKDNPQALFTDKEQSLLVRVEQTNVESLSAADIRDLATYVQDLAYQSAIKDRLIGQQQASHVRDLGDVIARETRGALKREMRSDSAFEKIRTMFTSDVAVDVNKAERTITSQLLYEAAERPEVTLGKLSPTLRQNVYDAIAIDAQEQYDGGLRDTTQGLSAAFNAVGLEHGDTVAAGIKRAMGSKDATALESWRNQERVVGGVKLTRGEALMIRRWLQDPNRAIVLQKAGVVLEEGNRKIPPLTPMLIAEVYDFVGPQGDAIANFMFEHDNGYLIDRVNATNEHLTGRALTDKRNVVPSNMASDDGYAKFLSENRGGLAGGFQEVLVDSYGSLKHRTDTDAPLLVPSGADAIDMFMHHADRMHRYTAFGVPARNAELILNDEAVKSAILVKNGRQGYEHIVNSVKQHVIGNPATGKIGRFLGWWNSGVAASQIAGKLSVMLMQPADVLSTLPYEEFGLDDLKAGMVELAKRGPQAIENEMERVLGTHSGNYWKRYNSDSFAGEHTSGQFRRKSFFRPSSVAQHALRPTARVEQLVAGVPNYLAAKAAARRSFGLEPDDMAAYEDNPEWVTSVVRSWDKKIYRGSNSSNGLELSGALQAAKENPVIGTFTNFYNTAGKIYSLFTTAVDEARRGNKNRAAKFAAAGLVGTAIVSAIQESLSFEQDDDEFIAGTAERAVANIVSLHPAAGQLLADNVIRPILGMQQYDENPVLVYTTAAKAIGGASDVIVMLADTSGKQVDPDKFMAALTRTGIASMSAMRLPAPGIQDISRRVLTGKIFPGVMADDAKPKRKRRKFATSL